MLVTKAEFARIAGVSRSAVTQAINNGLITAVQVVNGKTFIQKNEALAQYEPKKKTQTNNKEENLISPVPEGLSLLSWGQSSEKHAETEKTETPAIDNTDQPSTITKKLPDYTISRARSEFEKANLLELQRKTQEGLLLRREDVEQAWNAAVNITRTKLLGVPSVAKQRIPHLDLDEVELLTTLIREALEELSGGEVTA